MMLQRRTAIVAGSLAAVSGLGCSCAAASKPERHNDIYGCMLPDKEVQAFFKTAPDTRMFITGDEPMIPRSGDKDFDLALAQTLSMISDVFQVTPGFAYYDDYDGMNAYATANARLNGANGTVLFGQGMLQMLRRGRESPDVSVAAVCAHEFGHILQFRHGLTTQLQSGQTTTKRAELQADYFAGYFSGIRKRQKPSFPAAVFAMTFFNFGDTNFTKPSHHGTPDERAAALSYGFQSSFKDKKSLPEAIDISMRFVMAL
jgi:hypothetical protein